MEQDQQLIGTMEAADILGINRVTVWRMAQRGELEPAVIRERGRREILFALRDVEAFAEQRAAEISVDELEAAS